MPRQHNINGNKVPFTAKEEAEWDIKEQEWNNGAFDRAIANLRSKRDRLLASCDWVMINDSPIADKTAWETYRQALRDITNGLTTVADVEAVVFPNKP